MGFKEQVLKDKATLYNKQELAEDVTYNGVTITVVPNLGSDLVDGNVINTTQGTTARAIFYIQEKDVPIPYRGDTIIRTGEEWSVAQVVYSKFGEHKVLCTSRESVF